VFQSFKYGIPGALWLFVLMLVQVYFKLDSETFLRWVFGVSALVLASLWQYKIGLNGFTFRVGWFLGFNTLSAALFGFSAIYAVFTQLDIDPFNRMELSDLVGVLLIEFTYQSFIGLILITLITYLFSKSRT
jgi:hypothetical protein